MIVSLLTVVGFVIGHLGFWCTVFNQIHATRCPRSARKGSELLTLANVVVLGSMAMYLWVMYPQWTTVEFYWTRGWEPPALGAWRSTDLTLRLMASYWHFCVLLSLFFVGRWVYWQASYRRPVFLREQSAEVVDFEDEDPELLHGLPTQLIHALLPGSQLLVLSVDSKTFAFPQLPAAFDGYRISQLSDLHFTGRIGPAYFRRVFEQCMDWQPDMIVITGDLLDKPRCLDWIEPLFGMLRAVDGVYFILGNHDRRIKDEGSLRERLERAGLINSNGRYLSIERPSGDRRARLWVAGNELPWYAGAEQLEATESLRQADTDDFFIALSHSPDQWPWAKQMGFDLMLAGHTHGGQVRLPVIGPILAPSRYGVRYASGEFDLGGLAMQVSRGVSGAEPLRWNCPPELCQLTLRCG